MGVLKFWCLIGVVVLVCNVAMVVVVVKLVSVVCPKLCMVVLTGRVVV